jgi:hypothetical protein
MCYVMNLDAMLGPKLEQGLAGIKREAEKEQKSEVPVENEPAKATSE